MSGSESDMSQEVVDPILGATSERVSVHEEDDLHISTERKRMRIDQNDSDDDNFSKGSARRVSNLPITNFGNETETFGDRSSKRQVLEAKMARILRKPKGKHHKHDEDDLEQYLDEKILRLKDEMNIAAQKDIETLNRRLETGDNKLVAMEKVVLLPKVVSALNKVNLADTILDNNLLQSVRIWLEPLPDGSLPSFEIQKSLFQAIENLPIKTEHLKESGLGKVVIFYTKSKRVEPKLARLADKLVAEWTRPIIGASDNYRDKVILKMDFDAEKHRKKAVLDSAKSNKKRKKSAVDEDKHKSLYEQAAERRNRAAAPAQTTTDYKYAPISNVSNVQTGIRTTGVGSTLNGSDLYRRLNLRLSKSKRTKK